MKRITFLAAVIAGFMLLGAQSALAVNDFCNLVTATECQVTGPHAVSGPFTIDRTLHIYGGGSLTTGTAGIDITITPSGDFLMDSGALIDGNDGDVGGKITVTLVDGDVDLATGSIIRSNALSGGAIEITTTDSHTANFDGLIESVGSRSGDGSGKPGGGTITLIAGCSLTVSDTGIVSSRGRDPGADLVHLEGCTVVIDGLVESTASGHVNPNNPPNHCNLQPAFHDPLSSGGHSQFFTGCVEIWSGTSVLIDDKDHNGQVNADIGFAGGPNGRGWIDIYARKDITIKGMVDPLIDPTDPPPVGFGGGCSGHVQDISGTHPGCSDLDHYAVHSNGGIAQGTDDGGLITIMSETGKVITSDQAVQAAATSSGSDGGDIHVEAAGNIEFGTASIMAKGASNGDGGHIGTVALPVRSYAGAVNGALPGELNAGGDAGNGTVVLQACQPPGGPAASYLGTVTPVLTALGNLCVPTQPTLPSFVHLPAGDCFAQFCTASKSGMKFLDKNVSRTKDGGDTPLGGWHIRIFDSLNVQVGPDQVTDAITGAYSFTGLLPGSYTVCEVPQAGYFQTCPQGPPFNLDCTGNPPVLPTTIADCNALTGPPQTFGYSITLDVGDHEINNDFGNAKPGSKSGRKYNSDTGAGLNGWVIHLFGTETLGGAAVHRTQTTHTANALVDLTCAAGDGCYYFGNLNPGTYNVCEELQSGWTQTFPASGFNCVGPPNPDPDNTTPGPFGHTFTITGAGEDRTRNDFGNHTTATKSGKKFNDVDNSGSFTVGDTAIVGWPINLYKFPGPVLDQTVNTAGAGGSYSFTLVPGTSYRVCEGPPPSPTFDGFVQTFPHSGNVHPGETVVSTCPAPNIWGYEFTAAAGSTFTDDDFGNRKPPEIKCTKQTAIDIMNAAFPGNLGPDITVRTFAPFNESVQAAVDSVTDVKADGYLIIMVIAHADGSLGGSANQKVVVSKDYGDFRFGLFGCSVTLTGGGSDPAVWVKDTAKGKEATINGHPTTIFVADLHGGNSAVGVEADGTKRYLRNEGANSNGTGIKVVGNNNTVHNGSASSNTGVGLQITGSFNFVTDTAVYSNTSHGVQVTGSSNQLLKIKSGDIGKGNVGDGLNVSGNSNVLQENTARSNTLDGFRIVAGTGNTLKKNTSGGTASQNNGDCEFEVVAGNTNLGENKANNVNVPGPPPAGFPTGCIGSP